MSPPPRLGVYLTASPFELAWRDALIASATSAGWQFMDGGPPPAPASDDAAGILWIADDHTVIDTPSAIDWLVISDSPAAALASTLSRLGTVTTPSAMAPAIWYTAQRFAAASRLASDGARVLNAAARTLDLPYLGSVHRAEPPVTKPAPGTVLDVYRTLPPLSGATSTWPPELFTYPSGQSDDGPVQIDLTGRPRVLVYGPHIELPAGLWRATLQFVADPEGGHLKLRAEWGSGATITSARMTIGEAGRYAIRLDQNWLNQGPAEIRLWLDQASFAGRLSLLDVHVERL
tara:strand:+ start:421 stop:1290 length:870 start_codon:yes stop_codon:yes gene_type:complete